MAHAKQAAGVNMRSEYLSAHYPYVMQSTAPKQFISPNLSYIKQTPWPDPVPVERSFPLIVDQAFTIDAAC